MNYHQNPYHYSQSQTQLETQDTLYNENQDLPGEPEKEKLVIDMLSFISDLTENILKEEFKLDWLSLKSKNLLNSCTFDPETQRYLANITKNSSLNLLGSLNHITVLVRAFEIILNNLAENKIAKKRELYYLDPKLFKSQENVDKIIKEISLNMQVPRNSLNIVASNKGLVAGNLYLQDGEEVIDLHTFLFRGQSFPVNILNQNMENITTDAAFVLIVEKETVFYHLLTPKTLERLGPMILVTGKGYPDLETKYFLSTFHQIFPQIPLFYLGDCDPYGVDILCQYVFSNQHSVYEDCQNLDIEWIGVFPEDIMGESLDANFSRLQFKQNDMKKLEEILKRPYFNQETVINHQVAYDEQTIYVIEKVNSWKQIILEMKASKLKAEIEALHETQLGLIEFIFNKLFVY